MLRNKLSRTIARTIYLGALGVLLLMPLRMLGQDKELRLILKDGSYQEVKQYEVKGDRVRYLSAERDEWEELPTSLVDWPATDKFEKEQAAEAANPAAVQLDKEAAADELDTESLPEVAPGLRLPESDGVFLLETYKAEPQLAEIQQSEGDVNRNTKGNIFRGALNPIASAKATIELEGRHARVQSHSNVPSLYLNVDQDDAAQNSSSGSSHQKPQQPQQPQQASVPFDRYVIVKADLKGDKRIIGDVKRGITGKTSAEEHTIKTTIDRVHGGWLKITPVAALAAGEYALVEMSQDQGMNLMVWDFGVNPNAPANANTWKPEVPAENTHGPKSQAHN